MKWIAAIAAGIVLTTAFVGMAGAAEQYHSFMLTLDSPPDGTFAGTQWMLAGGFAKGVAQLEKTLVRGGKVHPWYPHVNFREGTLALDGKVLKGQFTTYDPMLRIGTWTLEGAVDGSKAAGTWTVKFLTPKSGQEQGHSGKFTGTILAGGELAKSKRSGTLSLGAGATATASCSSVAW